MEDDILKVQEELSRLNEAQRQVVENLNDHLLVMAPAGTGKTNVISLRVAHFIENQVNPPEILCLTFTNKACKELQNRLISLLGAEGKKVGVRTFHGFCYRLIKEEAESLGKVASQLLIIDEEDSKAILKELMPQEDLAWDKLYQYLQDLKLFKVAHFDEDDKKLIESFQQTEKAYRFYESLKNSDIGAYTLAYLDRFSIHIFQEYEKYLNDNQLLEIGRAHV